MAKQIIAPACGAATSQTDQRVEVSTKVGGAGGAHFPNPAALARVRKEFYDHADYYTGTIDDLIAAGLLLDSQLPGQPGFSKTSVSFDAFGNQLPKGTAYSKKVMIVTLKGRNSARIYRALDADQIKVREQEAKAQAALAQEAKGAEFMLKRLPATHDDYRKQTVDFCRSMIDAIWVSVNPNDGSGFSYNNEDRERIHDQLRSVWRVLNNGATALDKGKQAALINSKRAAIAKADPGFRAMLQSILPQGGVQA